MASVQPGASRDAMASWYRRRPMPTAVLRQSVSQLFMVGLPGPTLDRATRAFLTDHPPGGIILFKRNLRAAAQLRRLAEAIHATGAGVRPLVALDHEGGRVDRLPRPFTHFPPAAVVGAWRDPRLAEAVGRAMGRELRAAGIDLDFAPVLDVWSNPLNRVIGDRAFGTDPARVARLGVALALGLERAGVLACGKHFPGHGASAGDSHFVLPRVRRSRRAPRCAAWRRRWRTARSPPTASPTRLPASRRCAGASLRRGPAAPPCGGPRTRASPAASRGPTRERAARPLPRGPLLSAPPPRSPRPAAAPPPPPGHPPARRSGSARGA